MKKITTYQPKQYTGGKTSNGLAMSNAFIR